MISDTKAIGEENKEGIDGITPVPSYHFRPPENTSDSYHFILGIISDDDDKSKSQTKPNVWESKFIRGRLTWHENAKNLTVDFDTKNTKIFESSLNIANRGMELSELIYHNGELTAFDDKTGIVYKIKNAEIYPWVILAAGNGTLNKGFKSEWATIKNNKLIVGSHGYGLLKKRAELQWIKTISKTGEVEHINWKNNYELLINNTRCSSYIIHEAVCWSDIHKKWIFLPRKCSSKLLNKTYDEESSNMIISTDEYFQHFEIAEVGNEVPGKGFSSFKFLPGSDDTIIVALKTIESGDNVQTDITAFSLDGNILLQDTLVSNTLKFEGLEFIHPDDPVLKYIAPEKKESSDSSEIISFETKVFYTLSVVALVVIILLILNHIRVKHASSIVLGNG